MGAGPNELRLVESTAADPPIAILVMLAQEDDRVVVVDLSTHPCGQHILDDYAADVRLVPADRLRGQPPLLDCAGPAAARERQGGAPIRSASPPSGT